VHKSLNGSFANRLIVFCLLVYTHTIVTLVCVGVGGH